MPELPEIVTYLETLRPRIVGQPLEKARVRSPSLLRTWDPPVSALEGRTVIALSRIGKRIVWELEGDDGGETPSSESGVASAPLFAVFHLMVTGRLRWKERGAKVARKYGHAAFDFPDGSVLLTEAGTKKRASLHVVRGRDGLEPFHRGGLDVLAASPADFRDALTRENRTLKRALTDPRILDGIGNAHSDEILWRARLSPTQRTGNLDPEEVERLREAVVSELEEWTRRRLEDAGGEVPEKVSAFHAAMAVHGKHGEPCPRCGDPVQRIRYASNETNYCATCQTGGKLLADRALSRLLGEDWPRTLEELEELMDR
jgi:formamidopyrimidine-DNA glycosylase